MKERFDENLLSWLKSAPIIWQFLNSTSCMEPPIFIIDMLHAENTQL